MARYLTIHRESDVDRVALETRWTELAIDPRADWQMTLFNLDHGVRFCEWEASGKEPIEEIFRDLGIRWTHIIEVGVTNSSQWRFWRTGGGQR